MKGNIELIRIVAVVLIAFTHTRHNIDNGVFYMLFETVPTFGTPILSVISGYLFWKYTKRSNSIFNKKVSTLLVPYLIANIVVVIPSIMLLKLFNIDILNRLEFNWQLITEGILSLNEPPINPPTYFVRDIFVIYSIIAVYLNRNYKLLIFLIPLAIFGKLILRYDILILFMAGIAYANWDARLHKITTIISVCAACVAFYLFLPAYIKIPASLLLFILIINIDFKFPQTGGYSYLLHLYHSPIIVVSYPVIKTIIPNPVVNVFVQVGLSLLFVLLLFLLTRRFKTLKILSGSR